jgi:membrane protein YdbS with pleckstrin-like domain
MEKIYTKSKESILKGMSAVIPVLILIPIVVCIILSIIYLISDYEIRSMIFELGLYIIIPLELFVILIVLIIYKSMKKNNLIIVEDGLRGFPFKFNTLKFNDIREVILSMDKNDKMFLIALTDKNEFTHYLSGFNDMEEILKIIEENIDHNVEVYAKEKRYNTSEPIRNSFKNMLIAVVCVAFGLAIISAIIFGIIFLIVKYEIKISKTTGAIIIIVFGVLGFLFKIFIAPKIRKWFRKL